MILASLLMAVQVNHVHSTIPAAEMPLSWQVCDVDGDGMQDLLFATYVEASGTREWHYHRLRADGSYSPSPDNVLEIKKDIIAWGVGEFDNTQAGVEIFAQTRSAGFVLSPRKSTYSGIKKIASGEMFLDLASEQRFPLWSAIGDVNNDGRDEVVLANWTQFQVVDADAKVLGEIPIRSDMRRQPIASASLGGMIDVKASSQPLADLVHPNQDVGVLEAPAVLFVEESIPMPLLADANGNGFLDLLYVKDKKLRCHYYREQQPHFLPDADFESKFGDSGDWSVEDLQIVDAGGGPALDILLSRKNDGLIEAEWQHLLFLDAITQFRPFARPDSLLVSEAAWSNVSLCRTTPEANAPLKDLVVSSWQLKLQQLGMGGVDIRHIVSVYPALPNGEHQDLAALRYQRNYPSSDFSAFSLVPSMAADLNGDYRFDLLESNSSGQLEMRRLQSREGVLRFAKSPSFTIPTNALASAVQIEDLNQDGVGDVMLLREGGADIYITRGQE